jgi:hypothetical protein
MVEKQVNVNVNAKDNASSKIGTFTKNLGTVAANFNALKQAAQPVWGGIKDLINAFQEQEKASVKLSTALKNQGTYTKQTPKDSEDYSSALQKNSLYGGMAQAIANMPTSKLESSPARPNILSEKNFSDDRYSTCRLSKTIPPVQSCRPKYNLANLAPSGALNSA